MLAMTPAVLRRLRGGLVSMVFQEPMTALDPVHTIGEHIIETVRWHTGCDRRTARAGAGASGDGGGPLGGAPIGRLSARALRRAAPARDDRHVAVVRAAVAAGRRPTTALDATVQVQVLIMLRRLQRDSGMGMIFCHQ